MGTAMPEFGQGRKRGMKCTECSGSGSCDGCDGYGCYPDSYPHAGDGPDCGICDGSGECVECGGTGTTRNDEQAAASKSTAEECV